jgi:hypothetical protein
MIFPPGETADRPEAHPAIVKELRLELENWQKNVAGN